MVKRQTVWLSTMMVLSLMLIGYYTMNNDTSTSASQDTAGPSVSTAATGDPSTSTAGSTAGDSTTPASSSSGATGSSSSSTSTPSTSTSTASSSDFFVTMQMQEDKTMRDNMDSAATILNNPNATADQLKQASDKVQQLSNLEGEVGAAQTVVKSLGYKDCVIVPNAAGDSAQVYVRADKLDTKQAVAIINAVSQTLSISPANVTVQTK